MGKSSITMLCSIKGHMINAPNGIFYNSPPLKVVSVGSNTTFNDLVTHLCEALCKNPS